MIQNSTSQSYSIVKSEEVEYCSLIVNIKNKDRVIPGVIYQDRTYRKINSFDNINLKESIWKNSVLKEKGIPSIAIKDSGSYVIWGLDKKAKINSDPNRKIDIIYNINLQELVREIRATSTLEIKDRRYRLTVYPKCFIGSELVKWLQIKFKIDLADAIEMGQKLIDAKLMHHVCNDHDFKNDNLFYRFYIDE